MPVPERKRVYNNWTIVVYDPYRSLCRCKCGFEKTVQTSQVVGGFSKGCRTCGRKETTKKALGKPCRKYALNVPDEVFRRLRMVVDNAIARCADGYRQDKDYAKRGIVVCEEWLKDKRKFLEYLTTLPNFDDPTLVLDRINNDDGYKPGNLRFVNYEVSSRNRRRTYGANLLKDGSGRFTKK